MAAKATLVFCAQALLIQSAFSQCISPAAVEGARFGTPYGLPGRGWGYDGLAYDSLAFDSAWPTRGHGCGISMIETTPVSGGSLTVTSASALPPVGVSIASENVYEGVLSAVGELPFIGTVEVEGVLPTSGVGAVNYGCGTGETAMESVADILAPAISSPALGAFGASAFGPSAFSAPSHGYRASWTGNGFGYNL